MKANYHTHTKRCHHATGEDREYVESAIEKGLKTLGFSDHSPYIFPEGYYSDFRMRPEETEGYVRSVLALREEYKNDIDIYLGFEMEHHDAFFEDTLRFIEQFPYDYLILGQHYIHNEMSHEYSGNRWNGEAELCDYVNECIAGIETGRFFYIAHPDICYRADKDEVYDRHMCRLCEAAKANGVPLEINLLGIRSHRYYPVDEFFDIVGEVGNDVILGCDAHEPESMALERDIGEAKRIVERFGLHLVEPLSPALKK